MGIVYPLPNKNKLDKDAPFGCVPCVLSFYDFMLFMDHLMKVHGKDKVDATK